MSKKIILVFAILIFYLGISCYLSQTRSKRDEKTSFYPGSPYIYLLVNIMEIEIEINKQSISFYIHLI